jgi:hypothetical protein
MTGLSVFEQRLAVLDPKFAALYPDIPAGEWLPALKAAAWHADRLWLDQGREGLCLNRVLSDQHFRFRGGTPRRPGWYVSAERLCDRTILEADATAS